MWSPPSSLTLAPLARTLTPWPLEGIIVRIPWGKGPIGDDDGRNEQTGVGSDPRPMRLKLQAAIKNRP